MAGWGLRLGVMIFKTLTVILRYGLITFYDVNVRYK